MHVQATVQGCIQYCLGQDLAIRHDNHAIRLLPFELGLRFLTDHLEGDRYFRVTRHGDNLERARAQFDLVRRLGVFKFLNKPFSIVELKRVLDEVVRQPNFAARTDRPPYDEVLKEEQITHSFVRWRG